MSDLPGNDFHDSPHSYHITDTEGKPATADATARRVPGIASVSQPVFMHARSEPLAASASCDTMLQVGTVKWIHKKDEDAVTQKFVDHFNSRIGNPEHEEKANRLIAKMALLGGLLEGVDDTPHETNIPSARLGLCILAGLRKNKLKGEALDGLIRLLQNDQWKPETAEGLVQLAENLMKLMQRDLIQKETVDIQIKMATAYGLTAELIQRHYHNKTLNGITVELKMGLTATADALSALNTQENPELSLAVEYALEGIKRLKSDYAVLKDVLQRLADFTSSLASLYNTDLASFYEQITSTFKYLDKHVTHSWYNDTWIIHTLTRDAFTDSNKLWALQVFVSKKMASPDWKIICSAVAAFRSVALHGKEFSLSAKALKGQKLFEDQLPGLLQFISFHGCKSDAHNRVIQMKCAESLLQIAKEASDPQIREKAQKGILEAVKQLPYTPGSPHSDRKAPPQGLYPEVKSYLERR